MVADAASAPPTVKRLAETSSLFNASIVAPQPPEASQIESAVGATDG